MVVAAAENQGLLPLGKRLADSLAQELLPFCRVEAGPPTSSRGAAGFQRLLEMLKSTAYGDSTFDLEKLLCQAMSVDPDRVSLLAQAGTVDPASILQGERLNVFKNFRDVIPTGLLPYPGVRACHRIKPGSKHQLNKLLLDRGMAVLLHKSKALLDSRGRPISGGLFAVHHKVGSDRLINDRRPFNSIENRLGWAQLPHGSYC